MEDECDQLLNKHLQQIAGARPSIGWQIPDTFAKMQDITLNISPQLVADHMISACEERNPRFAFDMAPLFTLHLRSIVTV
jgi:hypothetical protein